MVIFLFYLNGSMVKLANNALILVITDPLRLLAYNRQILFLFLFEWYSS